MPGLRPAPADFAATSKHVVTAVVELPASPHDVWDVLADNATWTEWFPDIKSCRSTSPEPLGVGSMRSVHVGPLKVDEEFVAWDPPHAWGFTVLRANIPVARRMLERVDLEDIGTPDAPRTRATYTGAFEPHWLTRLFFGTTKKQVLAAWTEGLRNLGEFAARRSAAGRGR